MSDCNDTYVRDEVIFTSFIGNKEENDILVFLRNGRYLIFDNSGRVVRLLAECNNENIEVKNIVLGEKELS
jgi:hypothetical protein